MKRIENLKVDAIMTRNPVTVSSDSSAREVAKLLAKYHITSVAVSAKNGGIAGIVYETDILNVFNENMDKLKAKDIMSDNVKTILSKSSVKSAADVMKNEGIYSLVVIDENKKIAGILSAADITREMCKIY